jgi:hypothetical protein
MRACAGCGERLQKNGIRFRVSFPVTRGAKRDEIVERVASSVARLDDVVNGELRGRSAVPAAVAVPHAHLLAHRLAPALVQVGTVRGDGSTVAPRATWSAALRRRAGDSRDLSCGTRRPSAARRRPRWSTRPRYEALFRSRYCRSSCAASSISLWRHSAAR